MIMSEHKDQLNNDLEAIDALTLELEGGTDEELDVPAELVELHQLLELKGQS